MKKIITVKNFSNIENLKKILQKNGFFERPVCSKTNNNVSKIILVTTNACNLKCRYCYESLGDTVIKNMGKDMALKIISDSIKKETKELKLIFFGGEPTLSMDFIKTCVDYAKSLNIISTFQISTNGVVPTNILDYLIDNDFTIQISADGIPLVQNVQRPTKSGIKSSTQVEKTISYLVEKQVEFKIRMTVTPLGLKHLIDSVNYFGKLGVKYLHIESVSSSGGFNENKYTVLNHKKFTQEFINVLKLAKKLNMKIINSTYMNIIEPSTKFCGGLCGNQIVVNTDGNISVCYEVQNYCHPDAKTLMIGKFDSSKNKIRIEDSKLINVAKIDVNNMDKCKNCFAKFICSGGCPIRNRSIIKGGDVPENNPCDFTKHILFFLIKEIYKTSKFIN